MGRLSFRLFNRWSEYFEQNPEGADVRDVRAAMICHTIAQSNPYDKKRYKLKDFLPQWGKSVRASRDSGDTTTASGAAAFKACLGRLHSRLLAKQSKGAADGEGSNSNSSGQHHRQDEEVQEGDEGCREVDH